MNNLPWSQCKDSFIFFYIKTFKLQLPQKQNTQKIHETRHPMLFVLRNIGGVITYFGCYTEVWLAYEYSKHSTDSCDVPIQFWVQVRAGLDIFSVK